jgi:DNA-binding NarL/FixJ family response regulator
MRVLVVDDQVLFREGLVALLNHQAGIEVVARAGSGREAVELALNLRPDVILMDFSLGDTTGLQAMQRIMEEWCTAKVVFLSVHEDDDTIFAALRSGAKGYIPKNTPVSKLIELLLGVERDEPAIPPHITARLLTVFTQQQFSMPVQSEACDDLTGRELEVLKSLGSGASNRQIAERLFITENTVKNHVRSILNKLHVRSRTEAGVVARRRFQ